MDAAEDQGAPAACAPLPNFADIVPGQIESRMDAAIAATSAEVDRLLCTQIPYTWATFIVPLEAAMDRLARIWAPVRHLHAVRSGPDIRAAYNATQPKLNAFYTALGQNRALYEAYLAIAEGPEYAHLDATQRKAINDAVRDFRLAGVALEGQARARFAQIEAELSQLQTRFEENVLDATQAWSKAVTSEDDLSGLGPGAIAMARKAAIDSGHDCWLLTLDFPLFHAVMTSADDRSLRREVYEAWTTRASDQGPHAGRWDNGPVMERILALRQEKARLLGFPHYAALALEDRMVDRPEEVLQFLHDLAGRALPSARSERDELIDIACDQYGLDDLQPWDVGYFAEKLRATRFAISDETLKPYFPADRVIRGLFAIVNQLFGIHFQVCGEVTRWHEDVVYYRVNDANGVEIGGFYFDLYARSDKRGGAWMDECAPRMRTSETLQLPVAFLTCNLTPPVDGTPAQFTHDEVLTLFHEFGHGLHHLLTEIDTPSLSGINGVEWDAIELPSQLLENWCWCHEGLDLISGHVDTGEPLPAETVERLQASRHFHEALAILRQVEYSLFDFRLHMASDAPSEADMQALLDNVRNQVAVIQPPAYNRFPHAFAHIFAGGYAAGYYSYKWAEVLAADAFGAFAEEGLLDADIGRRFRTAVLARGGSRSTRENFHDFRGRDPDLAPLLRQAGLIDPQTAA